MKKQEAKQQIIEKFKLKNLDFLHKMQSNPFDMHMETDYKQQAIERMAKLTSQINNQPIQEIMERMIRLRERTHYMLYVFVDDNNCLYNCGISGYFKENMWILKHQNVQDFVLWFSNNLKLKNSSITDDLHDLKDKINIKVIKKSKEKLANKLPLNDDIFKIKKI